MIHILRAANKEFYVVTNGTENKAEPLSDSETVKTRLSCYKNIIAQGANFDATPPYTIQDNTLKKPEVQTLFSDLTVVPALSIVLSPVPVKKKKSPFKGNKRQIK